VLAIALLRAALTLLIGPTNMPFTLFFCAVAFSAWFGGFGPAVLSIALSLPIASWFFALPTHSLWVSGHDDQVAMLMIVVVGFGMALLSRSQRTSVDRARRSEINERNERLRFETTLASIGDAVIATDAAGRITFANQAALTLLASSEDDLLNQPLDQVFRIFNEDTRSPIENPAARALREGRVVGMVNHTILVARDGTERPIDDSAAPIRSADGTVTGVVLVFRDTSIERKSQQLMRKAEKLVTAGRLSAAIAHEINNPLAAIANLIYLARFNPDIPDTVAQQLILVEQELGRVTHITRQALGFYKESSKPERVEIAPLLQEILVLYTPKLRSKNIHVAQSIEVCPPVQGSIGELRQVVSNLIVNAIDAAGDGGSIRINATHVSAADPAMVSITIADSGQGIAPEHIPQLFEPFFTTKEVGTGLGLWVAKQIIERHGGTIEVRSAAGLDGMRGALFTLQLPAASSNDLQDA
jgi:PAS domain S-box-containing protein